MPIVLVIIAVASILSAPVVPLFTLPLFCISFPRVSRFWPKAIGTQSNGNSDSIYYAQSLHALAMSLQKSISSGTLGNVQAGEVFLVRFQDRLLFIMVIEVGYTYVKLSIKGLELMETSCHAEEATNIDEIFNHAFKDDGRWRNEYIFNTLTPLDCDYIRTYSDAKNTLTGLIDSYSTLEMIPNEFSKTLIWILLNHIMSNDDGSAKDEIILGPFDKPPTSNNTTMLNSSKDMSEISVTRTMSRPSIKSWSDDESLHEFMYNSNANERSTQNNSSFVKYSYENVCESPLPGYVNYEPKIDSQEVDLFGLPAVDINKCDDSNHLNKSVIFLSDSIPFSSVNSNLLSPPNKWKGEIPVDITDLEKWMKQFPLDWYQYVISVLDYANLNDDERKVAIEDLVSEKYLEDYFTKFIMTCYGIVNVLGNAQIEATSLGPMNVFKIFNGDIPWSTALSFLDNDEELFHLVIKAYRYAVKLSIDQTLFGPVENFEELHEYMKTYDQNWYIGCDNGSEWANNVLIEKENLFALRDLGNGVFGSRTLTLQDVDIYIGSLNAEGVKSQWANLNLELLYMTNDDEERYSIQAEPTILRNITLQAADHPLGYAIFSSQPVKIKTI